MNIGAGEFARSAVWAGRRETRVVSGAVIVHRQLARELPLAGEANLFLFY